MVILQHEIVARPIDKTASSEYEDIFTSTLIASGLPGTGTSAMATTVGFPLAIATLEVLDGKVHATGVHGAREVWQAVVRGMAESGFEMREERRRVHAHTSHDMPVFTVEDRLLNHRNSFRKG